MLATLWISLTESKEETGNPVLGGWGGVERRRDKSVSRRRSSKFRGRRRVVHVRGGETESRWGLIGSCLSAAS